MTFGEAINFSMILLAISIITDGQGHKVMSGVSCGLSVFAIVMALLAEYGK